MHINNTLNTKYAGARNIRHLQHYGRSGLRVRVTPAFGAVCSLVSYLSSAMREHPHAGTAFPQRRDNSRGVFPGLVFCWPGSRLP